MRTTQTIFNRLVKSSKLPESTVSYVENGVYHLASLEESIQEQVDLPDGSYNMVAGKLFRIGDLSKDRIIHPVMTGETSWKMDESDIKTIQRMSKLVAKDIIRPVMNCIFLGQNEIVASDAHKMGWHKVNHPFDGLLVEPTPVLMSLLKDTWAIISTYSVEQGNYVSFKISGLTYTQRHVEGKYPNWKSVIPEIDKESKVYTIATKDLKDITKMVESINKGPGLLAVKDTTMICRDADMTMEERWNIDTTKLPSRKPDALLMPMKVKDNEFNFGFKAKFLLALAETYDSVTFAVSSPDRGFLVWLDSGTPQKAKPVKKELKIASKPISKSAAKPSREPAPISKTNVSILDYSEKAIVVHGDTKPIKDALKDAGGRWNKFLKDSEGSNFGGWVFSKTKQAKVEAILEML